MYDETIGKFFDLTFHIDKKKLLKQQPGSNVKRYEKANKHDI